MSEPAVPEINPANPEEQASPVSASDTDFRSEPYQQVPFICLFGIIICFLAPWVNITQNVSGATMFQMAGFGLLFYAIPLLAAAAVFATTKKLPQSNLLCTLTAISVWLAVGSLVFKLELFAAFGLRWGASLSLLFALVLFAVSGKQRITAGADFVARQLSSRKADVYSHSLTVPPDIHFSAQEFYAKIQAAIQTKQWPGVEVLRINYLEVGFLFQRHGFLSHKREYLRIIRQRQVFDLCASTFGKDYFFSIREAEIPAVVTVRVFVAFLFFLLVVTGMFVQMLGMVFGPVGILFLLIFAVWFLFNVLKMGMTKVDSALLRLPIIGPIYDAWIRRETYFQQDTRMVFLQCMKGLTQQYLEETVSAKGFKFLDLLEKHPILGNLYQRSRIQLNQASGKKEQ